MMISCRSSTVSGSVKRKDKGECSTQTAPNQDMLIASAYRPSVILLKIGHSR